ncbi:MAG: hypothetical protein JO192_09980 [Candidatus Eremiobacteraeota bacterium]|nr:hypothetical protein [Candidatus Eremiobacteraeota bacterium]MBV8333052.1 hypothetical protein [Candidatus Eremiobacteraeota bacterium]
MCSKFSALSLTLAALSLSACASSPDSAISARAVLPAFGPTASVHGVIKDKALRARSSTQYLYVGSETSGERATLMQYGLGGARIRSVAGGIDGKGEGAFAFDEAGNLYDVGVSCDGSKYQGCVDVFAPGRVRPLRSILLPVGYDADCLGFDKQGELYVANDGPGAGSIGVFSTAGKLLRTISAGIRSPLTFVFDRRGNLYVADGDQYFHNRSPNAVTVYGPGAAKPARSISIPYARGIPVFLAVSPRDDLYVAENPLPDSRASRIDAFAPGASLPKLSIAAPAALLKIAGMAFDRAGRLVVAYDAPGDNGGEVVTYAPGTRRILEQLTCCGTSGSDAPAGVAIDSENRVYVGWLKADAVLVYRALETSPFETIRKGLAPLVYAVAIGPR